ncbi:MAG: putative glycoside hydrolase [Gemmatimonadota bacterium]|nr:putative glycoside hydrolase [Gemmatimonadota bacterium]
MRPHLVVPALLWAAPIFAQSAPPSDSARDSLKPAPRPAVLRGLYVSRWAALGRRMNELIEVAKRTEVNALVIDVKDDRGYVLYRSSVPLAHRIGADTVPLMPARRIRAILDTMHANGIYPIARIVVAKDPTLANAKRDWAVKRKSDGKPWLDRKGIPWVDPHQRAVWTYAADLAEEAVKLGFSQVQFDYVRFPDDPRLLREATFPLAKGRARDAVIREQLGYLRSRLIPLHALMAIDVFGLTTTMTTDMTIGQRWEQFADQADIVMPMTYPSHYYRGAYDIPYPNAAPYAVIDRAMRDGLARNRGIANAGEIIPWYQDFTLGRPRYGPDQVRAQMQGGYDNGVRSWVLWNPSSKYTLRALRPAILSEAEEAPNRKLVPADSIKPSPTPADTTKPVPVPPPR